MIFVKSPVLHMSLNNLSISLSEIFGNRGLDKYHTKFHIKFGIYVYEQRTTQKKT
jgi:hypothetical protein